MFVSFINMSQFFVSSDKVKTGQTFVAVPSENGLDYRPGGRIDLYIPPTSKFIDLSQTKLKFSVSLALPAGTNDGLVRLQLDGQTGLHSLIRSVRVFTGRKTALLEEIEGYDVLTALRFDYETNENLRNKRVLTDGATGYDPASRGTEGTTKTVQGNCFSNPYFSKIETNTTLTASFTKDSANDFQVVTGELELNTGLFRNDAVFPALLTDGLFIEILLQDSTKVFRQLDSTMESRRMNLNPVFHSTNGSDNGSLTNGSWKDKTSISSFYVTRQNNQTSVPTFPFVVGQRVGFAKPDGTSLNGSSASITQIEYSTGGAGTAFGTSKIKVSLSKNVSNTMGATAPNTIKPVLISRSTELAAAYQPTYTVSNVEMVVAQITVPDGYESSMMAMMSEGGTMNYDYRSFTNYRYSQVKDDLVVNMRLPLIESRATSILCVPTDATPYKAHEALSASRTYLIDSNTEDFKNFSARSGLVGVVDELQNYQLIYDGKINPSRRVDTTKISNRVSISQQWAIEAEKALAMADIEPLSFRAFRENFFVGRALALGRNSVYDARGKDFNLQLEYTGAASPSVNHLWMNFVAHVRRLVIRQGGLAVEV
tara:strand:+ start:1152 stop:2942 length:1791 start_codon:yes stop_codon:yes gene_type:complete